MKILIKAKTKEELLEKVKILTGKDRNILFKEEKPVFLEEAKKILEQSNETIAVQTATFRPANLQNITERLERKKKDRENFLLKHSLNNRMSKYITCKDCGSKIATSKLKEKEHKCPVCKGELYSKTLSEKAKKYEEQIKEIEMIRNKVIENYKEKIEWITLV